MRVAAGASRAPTSVRQKLTAESSGRAGAARVCCLYAVEQVRAAAAGVAAPGSVCVDVAVPADAFLAVAAGQGTFSRLAASARAARRAPRGRRFLVGSGSRCMARRLKPTAAPALSSCALLAPQACAPADTGRCHLRTLCLPRNGGGPGRQTPRGSFTQTRDGVSIDQSAVRVARAYGCSLLYGYSCGRTGSDASNTAAALTFGQFRALR